MLRQVTFTLLNPEPIQTSTSLRHNMRQWTMVSDLSMTHRKKALLALFKSNNHFRIARRRKH
jgi:hypothetical protein